MDITFQERELREICASRELCEQTYGLESTRDLFALVSDIESSRSIAELEIIHDIVIGRDSISVRLGANLVARFVSGNARGGVEPNEPTNWQYVRRLRLVSFER